MIQASSSQISLGALSLRLFLELPVPKPAAHPCMPHVRFSPQGRLAAGQRLRIMMKTTQAVHGSLKAPGTEKLELLPGASPVGASN